MFLISSGLHYFYIKKKTIWSTRIGLRIVWEIDLLAMTKSIIGVKKKWEGKNHFHESPLDICTWLLAILFGHWRMSKARLPYQDSPKFPSLDVKTFPNTKIWSPSIEVHKQDNGNNISQHGCSSLYVFFFQGMLPKVQKYIDYDLKIQFLMTKFLVKCYKFMWHSFISADGSATWWQVALLSHTPPFTRFAFGLNWAFLPRLFLVHQCLPMHLMLKCQKKKGRKKNVWLKFHSKGYNNNSMKTARRFFFFKG